MEIMLAVAALVGLFWLSVIALRGGLIGTLLALLFTASCLGHPFYHMPAGPLPLTLDRLLLGVLIAQYFLYRHWGWTAPKPLTRGDYFFAGLLAVVVYSTFAYDYSINKFQPVSQLILYFVTPAIIYWVARQCEWSERSAYWLFGTLTVFGLYLCVTAIAETRQMWYLVYPTYIGSSEFPEFFGRGRGPYLNPAANGIVQGLCLCATLMWWPRLSRFGRLMLLGVLPVFLLGMYCTFTRSVWIGAGAGLVIVAGLATPINWRPTVLAAAAISGVLVLALGWDHIVAFKRDKDVSTEQMADSAKLRPILATVAWHMFLDRPLLGCGYAQYMRESLPYLSDRSTDLPLEKARPYVQHNAFLALLTETGLIGASLFVAMLLTWTSNAWRLWRAATAPPWVRQIGLLFLGFAGVYLSNAMFHDVSMIPGVNMFLFFLGGVVTGLAAWLRSQPPAILAPGWDDQSLLLESSPA